MSTVDESSARRMTLGGIAQRYGFELAPPFASRVTITSIADDLDSVKPGCLYMPRESVGVEGLKRAEEHGAYAALVPPAMRDVLKGRDFPLLLALPSREQVGKLASELAGSPSDTLAIFAVSGQDGDEIRATVVRLADVLHMLGNPVGVISGSESRSLERQLNVRCPLGILDVQHTLSVCAEDGAAAIIIALDDGTLQHGALESVGVDVLGIVDDSNEIGHLPWHRKESDRYGFSLNDRRGPTRRGRESDTLAEQARIVDGEASQRRLSLAIAMVLSAGVHKNNISNALRVTHELR